MNDVAERLVASGMSSAEAAKKKTLFAVAERALGTAEPKRWYVPGRIEVLGKHTDYAGGPSLLCAAERGMCVAAAPRADSLVRVTDTRRGQTSEFPLAANLPAPDGWANYVATVVRRVVRNFPGTVRGVEIAFASDLPRSAGLSSSSALIIAVFTAVADANRLSERADFSGLRAAPENLAGYLGCVENGQSYGEFEGDCGVGTFGGSEDHTAILLCRAGQLSQYRFCPIRLEQCVRMPDDWAFLIGSSGVTASKTGAARDLYNHASLAAKAVLDVWNTASRRCDPSLDAAVRHAPDAPDQIRAVLRTTQRADFSAHDLLRRFEHYVLESQQLVAAASAAFAARDATGLGEIVDRSQFAAEQRLGNQVPETMALARSARELGALAASAFGAGFGGSVWALVRQADAEPLLLEWRARYASSFPGPARGSEFFVTGAGPGLTAI